MNKYDPDGKCIKCGGDKTTDEYEDHELIVCIPDKERGLESCKEHIKRTCQNCGFWWNEAPLDEEFSTFLDNCMKRLAKKMGISVEELRKRHKPKVFFRIKRGDTVKNSECPDGPCEVMSIAGGDADLRTADKSCGCIQDLTKLSVVKSPEAEKPVFSKVETEPEIKQGDEVVFLNDVKWTIYIVGKKRENGSFFLHKKKPHTVSNPKDFTLIRRGPEVIDFGTVKVRGAAHLEVNINDSVYPFTGKGIYKLTATKKEDTQS